MQSRLVLVIDDDENIREVVELVLGAMGLRVESARTGGEGVERAERLHPDLVLLDDRLPGLPSVEVLRRLKRGAQTAATPVVVMSALSVGREFHEAGLDAVLLKPFDIDDLEALVRRCLNLT